MVYFPSISKGENIMKGLFSGHSDIKYLSIEHVGRPVDCRI